MPKLKLTVPEGYEDIDVSQYKALQEILKDKTISDADMPLRILAALCNISIQDIKQIEYDDVEKLMRYVAWLHEEPDVRPTKNELVKNFTMGNVEFGFIPDWTKLTLGEFADLETYSQDTYGNLEKILAVLYRPIEKKKGDSYTIEPYNPSHDKQQCMLKCKMDIAIGALVFFYHIGRAFLRDTQRSLQ